MPNGQQKKQQIFFRLIAFAGRRWVAGIHFRGVSVNAKLSFLLFAFLPVFPYNIAMMIYRCKICTEYPFDFGGSAL